MGLIMLYQIYFCVETISQVSLKTPVMEVSLMNCEELAITDDICSGGALYPFFLVFI